MNPATSIRLFSLCENMKWNHLPEAGGLYDQHPDLLDQFQYIFAARAEYQEKERKRDEAERQRKKNPGTRRRR